MDGSSKNDLSAATFLGEPALIKLFVKYNTAHVHEREHELHELPGGIEEEKCQIDLTVCKMLFLF